MGLKARCPRSLEEARANPIKVVRLHWGKDFCIELNRPMSLQFDCGIRLSEPVKSGELICTSD